jgi:hypothetical protein
MIRKCIAWTMLLAVCFLMSQGCGSEQSSREKVSDKYAPAPAQAGSAGSDAAK